VRKTHMATALDLRQRRQQARMTLADMCEAMDVLNEPHVSAIEGGSRAITSDVAHALGLLSGALDAFDVTIRRDADTRHRGKLARKLGADRDVCLFEVKQGG
jgi:transcriptional regulator with XRE-family HTH domain